MTQNFLHGEPNPVDDPLETSSDTSIPLPETLSLPSTPSVTDQTPSATFPDNFPSHIDEKKLEIQGTNTILRLKKYA